MIEDQWYLIPTNQKVSLGKPAQLKAVVADSSPEGLSLRFLFTDEAPTIPNPQIENRNRHDVIEQSDRVGAPMIAA